MPKIDEIQEKYRKFVAERNWEPFHSPKNLAAALSVEASELLEVFMWLTEEQSYELKDGQLQNAKDEMADVLLYLIRLADVLKIDLFDAVEKKFVKVIEKYPVEKSRALAKAMRS